MHFPRKVQQRILKRCAEGEPVVVVPTRGGIPSRVFDLTTYQKKRETAQKVKPWTYRKRNKTADPLGAVDGQVLGSLRREELYE